MTLSNQTPLSDRFLESRISLRKRPADAMCTLLSSNSNVVTWSPTTPELYTATVEVSLPTKDDSFFSEKLGASCALHGMDVPNAHLIDRENGAATLNSGVFVNSCVDVTLTNFGVRTIAATPTAGLSVNGQPLKLRGGCVHHDHGALGAK